VGLGGVYDAERSITELALQRASIFRRRLRLLPQRVAISPRLRSLVLEPRELLQTQLVLRQQIVLFVGEEGVEMLERPLRVRYLSLFFVTYIEGVEMLERPLRVVVSCYQLPLPSVTRP